VTRVGKINTAFRLAIERLERLAEPSAAADRGGR
jgi:hypothetical protein